ncbi:MAG: DUF502 domain-containing protein [Cyclobacteriaceae bacterium]|nr:DUF502 domain-containing protein [Cyclobacteriaceae bacterium]MCH8516270.1 DUF502 domain-containing protein [Cyclobacteriaceae bacterium]
MSKFTLNRYITYFFRGLIFTAPIALTVYILLKAIQWIDGIIPIKIPGLGILTIVVMVTAIGFLASSFLAAPIFAWFERMLGRLPLVSIIYSSIKDLIGAFVGDKKKFNQPALITLNEQTGLQRLGFITQEDLTFLKVKDRVAIYMPHSYNFSGNLFLIDPKFVKPLDISSTHVMKFIVSGGVSGMPEADENQ